jgi:hypothetical protein
MLLDRKDISGRNPGDMSPVPTLVNSQIYFPFIRLALTRNTVSFNHSLRHEIRHIFQPDQVARYNRPNAIRTVRSLSALSMVGFAADAYAQYKGLLGPQDIPLAMTGGVASMAVASGLHREVARTAAWMIDGQEWDANIFSYRNRSYKPIRSAS